MEIRRLGAADVELYRAVRLRSVREHPEAFLASFEEESARTTEEDRQRLADKEGRDDDLIFAAIQGEAPVGLIGVFRLSPHRAKGRHKAMIWGMYVAPEARRTGLGRRLMQTAIDAITEAPGIELIQLGVAVDNEPACALYRSLGFESWGVETRAIKLEDRYIDEEMMVRILEPAPR